MKTANTLKKYLTKRLTTINSLLKKPTRLFSIADFHNLRVELKKVAALFELATFNKKTANEEQLFKPFKKILKLAGKVRDLQLQGIALRKYLSTYPITGYITNLKRLLVKEQIDFFSLIKKNKWIKLKRPKATITTLIDRLVKKEVLAYLEKEREELKTLIHKKKLKIQQVHDLRKLLKKFIYNYKSINIPYQDKLLKKINGLQKLMGKWHDARVMVNNLRKAIRTKKVSPVELEQLKKIKQLFDTSGKGMLTRINRMKQSVHF